MVWRETPGSALREQSRAVEASREICGGRIYHQDGRLGHDKVGERDPVREVSRGGYFAAPANCSGEAELELSASQALGRGELRRGTHQHASVKAIAIDCSLWVNERQGAIRRNQVGDECPVDEILRSLDPVVLVRLTQEA